MCYGIKGAGAIGMGPEISGFPEKKPSDIPESQRCKASR